MSTTDWDLTELSVCLLTTIAFWLDLFMQCFVVYELWVTVHDCISAYGVWYAKVWLNGTSMIAEPYDKIFLFIYLLKWATVGVLMCLIASSPIDISSHLPSTTSFSFRPVSNETKKKMRWRKRGSFVSHLSAFISFRLQFVIYADWFHYNVSSSRWCAAHINYTVDIWLELISRHQFA